MTNQQQVDDYVNGTSYQDMEAQQEFNFNSSENKLGRLHLVKKSLKDFPCRICCLSIPKGSCCYTQNIYQGEQGFPKSTRVCELCAKTLISEGTEVAPIKIKEKLK